MKPVRRTSSPVIGSNSWLPLTVNRRGASEVDEEVVVVAVVVAGEEDADAKRMANTAVSAMGWSDEARRITMVLCYAMLCYAMLCSVPQYSTVHKHEHLKAPPSRPEATVLCVRRPRCDARSHPPHRCRERARIPIRWTSSSISARRPTDRVPITRVASSRRDRVGSPIRHSPDGSQVWY